MTALAADKDTRFKDVRGSQRYPVAATTEIFAGSMVCLNAAGYAIPAADAATNKNVKGIADVGVDNTAGAAGDLFVKVLMCCAEFEPGALDQGEVGDIVEVADDQTLVAASVNSILVGELREIDAETGLGWVNCGY